MEIHMFNGEMTLYYNVMHNIHKLKLKDYRRKLIVEFPGKKKKSKIK